MKSIDRPIARPRLPVVLTQEEVVRVISQLPVVHRLFAQLLYGTGLRITEGLELRVKDVEFSRLTLVVRGGKGDKDRAVMLPSSLTAALQAQLAAASRLRRADRSADIGGVEMPTALDCNTRGQA